MAALRSPLGLNLLGELGVPDGLVALLRRRLGDLDLAHYRRALLPNEVELALEDMKVQHLLRGLRSELLLRIRRPRHLRVRIDTRVGDPHRRDQQEGDGDEQQVDERDHVDVAVRRALAALAATYVYTTHNNSIRPA